MRLTVLVRVLAALAVIGVAIFANLPSDTLFWRTLQDFAHCPAFIAVSNCVISVWPARWTDPPRKVWPPYVIAFAICLIAGVGIELAQWLIGGDVSAQDVFTDFLGTSAGLSAYALLTRRPLRAAGKPRRTALVAIGSAAFLMALAPVGWMLAAYIHRDRIFPVLAQFERPIDLFFLDARKSARQLVVLPAAIAQHPGERGLRVELLADRVRPGIFLDETVADWSGYGALALDLANTGDKTVTLRLRVHDKLHVIHLQQFLNDRYNTTLELAPHSRQVVRIPLEEIRKAPATRAMNMREIVGLGVFNPRLDASAEFYVTRIGLEP